MFSHLETGSMLSLSEAQRLTFDLTGISESVSNVMFEELNISDKARMVKLKILFSVICVAELHRFLKCLRRLIF